MCPGIILLQGAKYMCQVTDLLEECLADFRSEKNQEEMSLEDLKPLEKLDLNIPLWYKESTENIRSDSINSNSIMEPKAMNQKVNAAESNTTNATPEVTLETLKAQIDNLTATVRSDAEVINSNIHASHESTLKRLEASESSVESIKRGASWAVGFLVIATVVRAVSEAYSKSKTDSAEVTAE